MAAVTFFKTIVVGSNQPVGSSLVRLLEAHGLMFQDYRLSSLAQLHSSSAGSSFMVITPSIYVLDELQQLPKWLEQAQALDIPVLFLSTLGVFPAPSEKLWREEDDDFAHTEVARVFLQAEALVKAYPKHFIMRAGLPLYLDGHDFASRFLQGVRQQQNWQLDTQHPFSPTTSVDLAQIILAILQQLNCNPTLWGVYHCSGVEVVNAFQFGQALLEQARYYEDIPEVMISALDCGGEQPKIPVANGDNTKLFHMFGIRPKAWRQGLARLSKMLATAHQS